MSKREAKLCTQTPHHCAAVLQPDFKRIQLLAFRQNPIFRSVRIFFFLNLKFNTPRWEMFHALVNLNKILLIFILKILNNAI